MSWDIRTGDALELLRALPDESVDSVVTDPPYALTAKKRGGSGVKSINLDTPYGRARIGTGNGPGGFMGKAWDSAIPGPSLWAEALRAAKPGAHLLAFGGTRTFHRLTCAIEDGGWEIRDCLCWLYGQGFPKSLNIGDGLGTGLKPAWEPVVLARKALDGTVAANVEAHGAGALSIDACRIETGETWDGGGPTKPRESGIGFASSSSSSSHPLGRWPPNVAVDVEAAAAIDQQSGDLGPGGAIGAHTAAAAHNDGRGVYSPHHAPRGEWVPFGDTGGASRFFYCAKASRAERDAGLDGPEKPLLWSSGTQSPGTFQSAGTRKSARNNHPTVKPVELMRWLVRLVTPPGGLVIDPFTGSGSTGIAALREGRRFLGLELNPEYADMARRRIVADAPLLNGPPPDQEPAYAGAPSSLPCPSCGGALIAWEFGLACRECHRRPEGALSATAAAPA